MVALVDIFNIKGKIIARGEALRLSYISVVDGKSSLVFENGIQLPLDIVPFLQIENTGGNMEEAKLSTEAKVKVANMCACGNAHCAGECDAEKELQEIIADKENKTRRQHGEQ